MINKICSTIQLIYIGIFNNYSYANCCLKNKAPTINQSETMSLASDNKMKKFSDLGIFFSTWISGYEELSSIDKQINEKEYIKQNILPTSNCVLSDSNKSDIKLLQNISCFDDSYSFKLFLHLFKQGLIKQSLSLLQKMSKSSNIVEKYLSLSLINELLPLFNNLIDIQYKENIYSKKEWSVYVNNDFKSTYVKNNINQRRLKKIYNSMQPINGCVSRSIMNKLYDYILQDMRISIFSLLISIIDDFIDTERYISALIILNFMQNSRNKIYLDSEFINKKRNIILNNIKEYANLPYKPILSMYEELTDNKLQKLINKGILSQNEISYITEKQYTST